VHALSALLTPPASRRTAGYRSFPLIRWLERAARAVGFVVVTMMLVPLAACGGSTRPAPPPRTGMSQTPGIERGMATFYGDEQGTATASGERFDKRQLTAAHRTLPFGTRVRVTNTRNGRSVEVRINDRGPFGKHGRIIDVSEAAARRLGMIDAGVVPVTIEIVR
jgi:rare lipoprotein A